VIPAATAAVIRECGQASTHARRSPAISTGLLDILMTYSGHPDPTRDTGMTFYTYPQPVLKPQLEHV
jgi:hypothetical protein